MNLLNIHDDPDNTLKYLITRVKDYALFMNAPEGVRDLSSRGIESVDVLRKKLLIKGRLDRPTEVTVTGTLFPAALLAAGWWDLSEKMPLPHPRWRDGMQKWLFYGFDLWGPSWDFCWKSEGGASPCRRIAQLGDGDESDSIPVVIPAGKAEALADLFSESGGGCEVRVTALVGHRGQFAPPGSALELVGGLLDFCLWLDDEEPRHRIECTGNEPDIYSGYLWRCVTPRSVYEARETLTLSDVFFLWEHTNLLDAEAVAYNLDSLEHKQEYVRERYGELLVLQKSSLLVPGDVKWSDEEFSALITGAGRRVI